MHELSLARSIIDIVKSNVPSEQMPNVKIVLVKVGDMSGVVSDSLLFCYDAIKTISGLGQSTMKIEKISFLVHCNECNKDSTNDFGLRACSLCSSFDTEIISGTEMSVTEVELS